MVVQERIAPLLELDEHVGRRARPRLLSGQDDVDPFAGQRELVLDEDLDVVQTCVEKVLGKDGQAAGPGSHLGRCGPPAGPLSKRLCQSGF